MRLYLASRVSTLPLYQALYVATLRELPKYEHLESLPYLCSKNETMAPLHVATLTVQRELPKYEMSSRHTCLRLLRQSTTGVSVGGS